MGLRCGGGYGKTGDGIIVGDYLVGKGYAKSIRGQGAGEST